MADASCTHRDPPLKPGQSFRRPSMLGIVVIVSFIAVIAILNRIDFGRFD